LISPELVAIPADEHEAKLRVQARPKDGKFEITSFNVGTHLSTVDQRPIEYMRMIIHVKYNTCEMDRKNIKKYVMWGKRIGWYSLWIWGLWWTVTNISRAGF